MASFRKRGDVWRAEVYKNGVRESSTFATKREAQEWANKRELELSDSTAAGIISRTLGQVLERYRDEVAVNNKGYRWDRARIGRFLVDEEKLCKVPIHLVTTSELATWRDKRLTQVKPASVRRDIALLRAAWRYARKEWGNVKKDVWLDLTIPKKGRNRERSFTQAEIDRIVGAMGYQEDQPIQDKRQQTAVALLLALETAMRSGELLSLRWPNVDLQRQVARLEDTKNGDTRDVPLSTRAVALFRKLEGLSSEKPFTVSDDLRDVYFRHGRDLAGITGVTFHDSRATALTRLSKKLDILQLARMVGHRDPRSLMIYYRENASDTAQNLG